MSSGALGNRPQSPRRRKFYEVPSQTFDDGPDDDAYAGTKGRDSSDPRKRDTRDTSYEAQTSRKLTQLFTRRSRACKADSLQRDRLRRHLQRPVRSAPRRVLRLRGLGALPLLCRGFRSRRGAAALLQHAHHHHGHLHAGQKKRCIIVPILPSIQFLFHLHCVLLHNVSPKEGKCRAVLSAQNSSGWESILADCPRTLQTTMFRHEARDVVRNAVNASEHDSVIFAGTGCTGAVHKLIDALGLR